MGERETFWKSGEDLSHENTGGLAQRAVGFYLSLYLLLPLLEWLLGAAFGHLPVRETIL